jgi:ketosteroid isomerase-like protein
MRRSVAVATLVGAGLVSPFVSRADDAADHNALRKARQVYEEAMNSGDLDKLRPYLAANSVHVAATGDEMQGIDGVKAFWRKIQSQVGSDATYHVEVNPDLSDLYGDIAIAHGLAKERIRSTALGLDFDTRWLAIFHRENDGWKLVRSQATINAFDNPVVTLLVKRARWVFGVGGLLAGAAVGFLLGRRSRPWPAPRV